jgi:RelA/SpoT family (p)ppGpp synthetase
MTYTIGVCETTDYIELLNRCKQQFSEFDSDLLRLAFEYCVIAHEGKLRKSGHKYYTHPLSVAYILLDEIPLDMESVIAALLHNVLDESDIYTYEDIRFTFGESIAAIVDGVSRIKFVESQHIERADQLDNYRKLLLTLFTDIRIILVKLADRLDNMRTLQYVSTDSQSKFAQETLDIYSPFANRFGLTRIKFELEDLSFKYLHPDVYKQIEDTIKGTHHTRTEYINRFKEPIVNRLEQEGLLSKENVKYRINGRAKNIYSIYNKTIIRHKSIDELYDIFAIRIILNTDNPLFCYYVYGIVGSMYKPIPETFKDYISVPKANGYRSLHTAIVGPGDRIVEVQIRTEQMHKSSEVGVAAHFRYKSGVDNSIIMEDIQIQSWLDEIRNIFNKIDKEDSSKLLSLTLQNRLANKIYVFTPQDEFKELQNGSTVLDFAFEIHTDMGLRCLGAKVNGKFCSINHILNSGDKVEVLVSDKQEPENKWLDYVITPKATIKLIHFFKRKRKVVLRHGKQLWNNKNAEYNFNIDEVQFASILKNYNFDDESDFYVAIGNGSLNLDAIYPMIISGITESANKSDTISLQLFKQVSSYKDTSFIFSACCNPIPGDSIFGIEKLHRQIEVHNNYCFRYKQLFNTRPDDIIILDWEHFINREFHAKLRIIAEDKLTLMDKIINIVRDNDINQILTISYDLDNGIFDTTIEFRINNNSFINMIIENIENISGVKSVERVN